MILEKEGRHWVGHDHEGSWMPKVYWLQDRFSIVMHHTAPRDRRRKNVVLERGAEFSDSYNILRVPLRWGFKDYNDALLFLLAFPSVYTSDWRHWEGHGDE